MHRLRTAASKFLLAGAVLSAPAQIVAHVPGAPHAGAMAPRSTVHREHAGTSMLLHLIMSPFALITQTQAQIQRAELQKKITAATKRLEVAAEQQQLAQDQHLVVAQNQQLATLEHQLAALEQQVNALRSQVVTQKATPFVAFRQATVPAAWLPVLVSAATGNGVCMMSWTTLAAIAAVESGFGTSTLPGVSSGTNAKGAAGPMQFKPATFAAYALPAPPGGVSPPSPYNVTDAVYAAARLLCTDGIMTHPAAAIHAYNHSSSYVAQVEAAAAGFANATAARALGSSGVPAMGN